MTISPSAVLSTSRRTITTATGYADAERAVDWLSDKHFPVSHVTIVGSGLRYVEHVSGRQTTGRATLMDGGQGAALGLLWGLLFGLFFTVDSGSFFSVVAYGVSLGIVFGAVWGFAMHAATHGRHDFASQADTRADRYEVQVDDAFADTAERLLARMPAH